eukprot:1058717-Rhodomonas_salina.2
MVLLKSRRRQTLGEGVGHVVARWYLAKLEDVIADKLTKDSEVHPRVNVAARCGARWMGSLTS